MVQGLPANGCHWSEDISVPLLSQGQKFLSGSSCPPFTTTLSLLQVSATDEDGPANSAITYSLVGGNQLGHFTVHPKKGELQVAKALDWEQVSHVGGAQSEFIRAIDMALMQVQGIN